MNTGLIFGSDKLAVFLEVMDENSFKYVININH